MTTSTASLVLCAESVKHLARAALVLFAAWKPAANAMRGKNRTGRFPFAGSRSPR